MLGAVLQLWSLGCPCLEPVAMQGAEGCEEPRTVTVGGQGRESLLEDTAPQLCFEG